jgi:hypothetical protein
MGKHVEGFFDRISLGFLSYCMDWTHSVMQIKTTASPISQRQGADATPSTSQESAAIGSCHFTCLFALQEGWSEAKSGLV